MSKSHASCLGAPHCHWRRADGGIKLAAVNTLRRQSRLVLLVAGLVLVARLLGVHGHFCTLDDAGCIVGGHAAAFASHSHDSAAHDHAADAVGERCAGDCDAKVSLELLTLSKLLDDLPEAGALLACLLLLAAICSGVRVAHQHLAKAVPPPDAPRSLP